MSISGVVVDAHPAASGAVRSALSQIPGVDVHTVTEAGRLVVTIDQPDDDSAAETLHNLRNIDGVLSTVLVFNHMEPIGLGVEQ